MTPMTLGQRRFLVTLTNPGPAVPDGRGGSTPTAIALVPPTAYARIVPATGKDLERLAAGTVLTTLSRLVTLPYHSQITTNTRLTWTDFAGIPRGANVTGASPNEHSTELELVCVEVVP